MRGLKSGAVLRQTAKSAVAPLAGAWIEIQLACPVAVICKVAPLAGAWIEIVILFSLRFLRGVAPLAGAWIEIFSHLSKIVGSFSVAPLAGAWIEIFILIILYS